MWFKKVLVKINSIYSYDQGISKNFPNFYSLSFKFLFLRTVEIALALPISLLLGTFFLLTSSHKKTKIIILRQYRPSFASQYIAMVEPLQRLISERICISQRLVLLNPGERFNTELQSEAAHLFWKHLDDGTPFLRLSYFLIPNYFVEKKRISANEYKYSEVWNLPPRKVRNTPSGTLLQSDIQPMKFICFGHPSHKYYEKRLKTETNDLSRFVDFDRYSLPLKHIHSLGLQIVRMGIDTDDLPDTFSEIPIYDFSRTRQNEIDELWLYCNCRFFLSIAGNGGWWFAKKYGRPSLITDGYKIFDGHQATFQSQRILWDERSGRALSFGEQILLKGTDSVAELKSKNLHMVPNPAELIIEAIDEILNYELSGHCYTNYQKALMSKWDSVTSKAGFPNRHESWTRPSIAFLQTYEHLIY